MRWAGFAARVGERSAYNWGNGEIDRFDDVGVIHLAVCLTTGPKPPPKRCLHIVRS